MYKDDIRLPILSKIPARAGLYMLLYQQIGLVPGRKCNDDVNNCVMVKNSNKNQILHLREFCEGSLRGVSPDNYQRSKVVSTDIFSWTDVSTVFFLFVCSVVILSFRKKKQPFSDIKLDKIGSICKSWQVAFNLFISMSMPYCKLHFGINGQALLYHWQQLACRC
jgi:hypothetical protein